MPRAVAVIVPALTPLPGEGNAILRAAQLLVAERIDWGSVLEADEGLAAKAAVAKLFEGADACSDRAAREHVRNLVKPSRRRQGTRGRRNVVRRDLPLCEPPFVCRIDRREKVTSGLRISASRR